VGAVVAAEAVGAGNVEKEEEEETMGRTGDGRWVNRRRNGCIWV
jgi:hypothetical protein